MSIEIMKSSIVAPSGAPMVMIGGDCHTRRVTGDIVSEFKWVDGEPVMLLYKRVLGHNTPAFMIEMKDAYRFSNSNGSATKELLKELSQQAAEALNSEHDRATCSRIITVILDGIPDLLYMPPEPKALKEANRPTSGNDEVKIILNGEVIMEAVV
jgi:hypothetical protein